jgi:hypothetical protein
VSRKYANNEERQAAIQERQRLRRAAIALKRVACNGAQHEEARCMIDTVEDQLQVGQHMALRDLQYPLADPQVDW